MKTILLVLFLLSSFFVRALRWLALMQQKEYRFDRVWLFLQSKAGKAELLRLFPKRDDFSRTGLKRPKLSYRVGLVALIFLLVSFLYFKFAGIVTNLVLLGWYPYPLWYRYGLYFLFIGVYLVLLPLLVMLSVIPTVLVAYIISYQSLFRARKLILKAQPKVIGVTGSYGKTSTKLLLSHVLAQKFSVFKTPKSHNTKYSVASSILKGYQGEKIALIEYAAYKKGEIKQLASWIKPSIAIITGLARQHLGLFGSLMEIIQAKSELVASLDRDGLVVCNTYHPETRQIYDLGSMNNKVRLVTVGPKTRLSLTKVKLDNLARLSFYWGESLVKTRLIGLHYFEVVQLVIVVALELGVSKDKIIEAIESFIPNDNFISSYTLVSGVRVIDDGGSSNPKGFAAVIELAQRYKARQKVLITSGIVDLGVDSDEIHLKLAAQAQTVFNQVVYVGQAGREVFKQVWPGEILQSREQLNEVLSNLAETDLVVIEGRMPGWVLESLK